MPNIISKIDFPKSSDISPFFSHIIQKLISKAEKQILYYSTHTSFHKSWSFVNTRDEFWWSVSLIFQDTKPTLWYFSCLLEGVLLSFKDLSIVLFHLWLIFCCFWRYMWNTYHLIMIINGFVHEIIDFHFHYQLFEIEICARQILRENLFLLKITSYKDLLTNFITNTHVHWSPFLIFLQFLKQFSFWLNCFIFLD